jgi:hypothetical protein
MGGTAMIQARIRHGKVELDAPLPAEWEGRTVKILPLTPDDPMPDLEERLAALRSLGPVELDVTEKAAIANDLAGLDRISREAMQSLAGRQT